MLAGMAGFGILGESKVLSMEGKGYERTQKILSFDEIGGWLQKKNCRNDSKYGREVRRKWVATKVFFKKIASVTGNCGFGGCQST